jgi:c-di-GMP-binding flagellar brake protein YcgR
VALQKESTEQGIDFDSLCLQVGTRLQLEVLRDVKPIQVISSLIGYVYGEYLIVRMPDPRSDPIAFRVGEKITIRLFSGVKVCAFDVTVQRLFEAPLLYMHVSFPQSIRGANLRSAMRVKTTVPSILRTSSAAAELQVALRNLSAKGALIESPQKCGEVGERVHLSFAVPCMGKEGGEVIRVDAFVRNVSVTGDRARNSAEPAAYLCGVEFGSLSQLHQLVLQNFTYEAAFSQRQSIV